jgi:hypothetical protein
VRTNLNFYILNFYILNFLYFNCFYIYFDRFYILIGIHDKQLDNFNKATSGYDNDRIHSTE